MGRVFGEVLAAESLSGTAFLVGQSLRSAEKESWYEDSQARLWCGGGLGEPGWRGSSQEGLERVQLRFRSVIIRGKMWYGLVLPSQPWRGSYTLRVLSKCEKSIRGDAPGRKDMYVYPFTYTTYTTIHICIHKSHTHIYTP